MLQKVFIHNGNCQCQLFTHKIDPHGQIEQVREPRHSLHIAPLGGVWTQIQAVALKRFLVELMSRERHLWAWDVVEHAEYNRDGCRVDFLEELREGLV